MGKTNCLVPVDKQDYLENILKELSSWEKITIKTSKQLQNAVTASNSIKKMVNSAKEHRTGLVRPFKAPTDEIYGYYLPRLKKADSGLKVLVDAISDFQVAEQRRKAEEQRKLNMEAETKRKKEEEKARIEAEKIKNHLKNGREDLAMKANLRMESAIEKQQIIVPKQVTTEKLQGASFSEYFELSVFNHETVIKSLVEQGLFDYLSFDKVALEKKKKSEPFFKLNGCIFKPKVRTISKGGYS